MIQALNAISFTDRSLGVKSKHNAVAKTCQKLLALLLLPFFGCEGVSHVAASRLGQGLAVGHNMLYRMMRDGSVDWRALLQKFGLKVERYLSAHCESYGEGVRCLVADDTDIAKSGRRIEHIGKVFSHTEHRHILGFKALLLGLADGKTFRPLDVSLHCEQGRDGTQCMSAKERKARLVTEQEKGGAAEKRHEERLRSKLDVLIEMVERAFKAGTDFDYLLVDSWFTCARLVSAVLALGEGHHFLGMLKMGREKFEIGGEKLDTNQMVSRRKKEKKRCRKYNCHYIVVDTRMDGHPVRLFLCRRSKHDGWKALLSTDISLSFIKAYELYAVRWAIEVCFKECKQYLGLEENQAQHFNSQIASVTISLMRYTLLSVVKRVTSYETLGGLFRGTKADVIEVTLLERVLLVLQEVIEDICNEIGFPNKKIVHKILSDKMTIEKITQHLQIKRCA